MYLGIVRIQAAGDSRRRVVILVVITLYLRVVICSIAIFKYISLIYSSIPQSTIKESA